MNKKRELLNQLEEGFAEARKEAAEKQKRLKAQKRKELRKAIGYLMIMGLGLWIFFIAVLYANCYLSYNATIMVYRKQWLLGSVFASTCIVLDWFVYKLLGGR